MEKILVSIFRLSSKTHIGIRFIKVFFLLTQPTATEWMVHNNSYNLDEKQTAITSTAAPKAAFDSRSNNFSLVCILVTSGENQEHEAEHTSYTIR